MSGRLIDIPYWTSPPIIFTYRETAALLAGSYVFAAGTKNTMTPSRPILPNALYSFSAFDFAMDIAEADYHGSNGAAGGVLPEFSMYVQGEAAAPALREPIPLSKYFTVFPYILHILGSELLSDAYPGQNAVTPTQGYNFNRLLGSVAGTLIQTANLLGKENITAIVVFSAQEIVDEGFVAEFRGRAGMKRYLAQDLKASVVNRLRGREFL